MGPSERSHQPDVEGLRPAEERVRLFLEAEYSVLSNALSSIVPEDCSASITAEMHRFAIEKVLPDIATISTADDLIVPLQAP